LTTLVKALGGKPLNVLTVQPTMTMQHLESLGVRRISVGGALARMACAGFMQSAQEIAVQGTFTSFANRAKGGKLNKLFGGK
jgi:2-methylisocitrate lyase-like PEP mutase family enzyme